MAKGIVNTVAPHTHPSEEICVGKTFTVTLTAEGWSEERTQTIKNANFLPEEDGWSYFIGAYPSANDFDTISKALWVGVMYGGIKNGEATFECGIKPTERIRLSILRFRTENE